MKSLKSPKNIFQIFILTLLFTGSLSYAPQASARRVKFAVQQQVLRYETCVKSLAKQRPNLEWLEVFAACSARNDSNSALKCLADFHLLAPNWNKFVSAMACAGGAEAKTSMTCMNTLYQNHGDSFDPSITNTACSAGGNALAAETCMLEVMKKTDATGFGIGNVLSGLLCGGANTSRIALSCFKAATDSKLYEVFAAQACSGGNDGSWVQECMSFGTGHLKGLLGTSGQEERAAAYACAASNIIF